MKERDFLQQLQERAREQQHLMHSVPFPQAFIIISEWLGTHPWRLLIPLAFVASMVFRAIWGQAYDDFILTIFGKI